jgi:hypothetical protein
VNAKHYICCSYTKSIDFTSIQPAFEVFETKGCFVVQRGARLGKHEAGAISGSCGRQFALAFMQLRKIDP